MGIDSQQVLGDLAAFRSSFAQDLDLVTGVGSARADRAAAQDGLQLIWSFTVSGLSATDELDATRRDLLRAAFPDELFGPDPGARFDELREKVPNNYADRWKHMPSEHLCSLIRGCVTFGDPAPVARYHSCAVVLAADTCGSFGEPNARMVFDLAKFDSMLKHARILTEVAVAEAAVPSDDQIRSFALKAGPDHSLSFAFMTLIDQTLALRMVAAFSAQHGPATTDELLESAMTEVLDETQLGLLASLRTTAQTDHRD